MTVHNLEFYARDWPRGDGTISEFKVGTVQGLYHSMKEFYEIIAIVNKEFGNGHFEDTLEWFETSCRRDKKKLRFGAIINERFAKHLVEKRGFTRIGEDCEKQYD